MRKLEKFGEEIGRSLEEALPGLRKAILKKLPLAVAAMIQARTPNTLELSTLLLPLTTERADMREQWLRRLLSNPLIDSRGCWSPSRGRCWRKRRRAGRRFCCRWTRPTWEIASRHAMISVRCGDRSRPLASQIETGEAHIGFSGQQVLLERVRAWLPDGAAVICRPKAASPHLPGPTID